MDVEQESSRFEPSIDLRATVINSLDSDDETMMFDKDDDLYDSGMDENDARWVRKQHRPAAEYDGEPSAKGLESDHRPLDGDNSRNIRILPEVTENVDVHGDDGGHRQQEKGKSKGKGKVVDDLGVESDAQLSCPLCFTTVCLECQRHVRYHNQFRAVTGINVTVKGNESLTFEDISGEGGKRSKRNGAGGRNGGRRQQSAGQGEGGGDREGGLFHSVCCAECDHRVGVLDEEDVFHFFGVIAMG